MLKVTLAAPRGFCTGVERAIRIADRTLKKYGAPIYVRKEIVHNKFVVETLAARGCIFVENLSEIPKPLGKIVIFSAHGVSPQVYAEAIKLGLRIVDAICPLVQKVHVQARKAARAGKAIVLIGHTGHEEVEGVIGEIETAGGKYVLVQNIDEAQNIDLSALQNTNEQAIWLSQTTLNVAETEEVVSEIRKRVKNLENPASDCICFATKDRQNALQQIAPECDFVIVVGSENSSNTNRLYEVAAAHAHDAIRVNNLSELLENDKFKELMASADALSGEQEMHIGLTSGASVPENLVAEIWDYLQSKTRSI
ncbi:MAG: 4-hydroxy-3-methylbut-2-enyl diphosphate reductase [Bifidobacteriaceae bacterium]|jgi:4-hydroxy-3-methylbut-2-enyl diphosphate reductase|nr:4-hydroxy-3-methylbut-2-enyl diphosphate reductase [Bifidobacteriaceae bacterium]